MTARAIHGLFASLLLLTAPAFCSADEAKNKIEKSYQWYEVSTADTEGQGWVGEDLTKPFDRLPAKGEKIVREAVWNLSRHSSGISFQFNTDSNEITLKYRLSSTRVAMPHMPATGVSGIDLYARDGEVWKWVSVSRPTKQDVQHSVTGLDPGLRTYLIYLPLYNGVDSLSVGVSENATFQPVSPRKEKPIVYYGTSITHGACASRPGMTHPAILSRRLDHPFINLGFSGNGRMEAEVGALLTEIDAAVYVIDCLPNLTHELVAERAVPLVQQIRKVRPDTPIVLVEDRSNTNSWLFQSRREHHAKNRAALIRAFDELVSSGVKNLFYIEGADLLGDDKEGATDGSHPNDLGFMRQADVFEPVLHKALEAK